MRLFNNDKLRTEIRRSNADLEAGRAAHEAQHVNPYDHKPAKAPAEKPAKRR